MTRGPRGICRRSVARRLASPFLAALLASGCAHPFLSSRPAGRHAAEGRRYMVAADHELASRAGAEILERGGNAVDAAVATSLALCVTRPYSTGLGGGGFMMIKLVGRDPVVLDYRETAPAGCHAATYLDGAGARVPGKSVRGPWSVGTPGLLRGLQYALEHYGTMTWLDVSARAIELARHGFKVDAHTHEVMQSVSTRLSESGRDPSAYPELERIFFKDGLEPYAVGEVLRQPDLAESLRRIASAGAEDFYTGALADRLLDLMRSENGPLSAGDLAAYRVRVRKPLMGRFQGYTVVGMPPPSSGGACMIQMLGVLDGYDLIAMDAGAYHHLLVECMKHAYAARSALLGDADADPAIAQDAARMVSSPEIKRIRAAIDLSRTRADPRSYGDAFAGPDSGTSHYSVVDSQGNAVAATETINYGFGSFMVVPNTGIVLNNELNDFTISGAPTNAYGMTFSSRNAIQPGHRPLSSMSPTMVLDGDRVVIAAGASGGTRIITATMQSILQVLVWGKHPAMAVNAPRVHHQWIPDIVYADDGISSTTRAALEQRGHTLAGFRTQSGVCQLIHVTKGRILAASDARKGGRPAGR